MNKADKIALAYSLGAIGMAGIFITKSYMTHRKIVIAERRETAARNYATLVAIKMFQENQVTTREELESEWQFAYMIYLAQY